MSNIVLWHNPEENIIPKTANITEVMTYNRCLTEKDIGQISIAYSNSAFEMAANFIWEKSMNKLRKFILSFGPEFVLEMMGIKDMTFLQKIPEKYTIDLSYELGIIPKVGKMKLTQCNEFMSYFLSTNCEEEMDVDTTNLIIRSCIEYVLQKDIEFSELEFYSFRDRLKKENFVEADSILKEIKESPYFYKKTIIRTLLNLISDTKGIELDNSFNNLSLIVPLIWDEISVEDRWLVGTAYTDAVNTNDSRKISVLKNLLLKLKGFDYVPENVRSNTFIDAAKNIIAVHNAMNNFYNEPQAVEYLYSLGTVIPRPAVGHCISALLCVKLGNYYSHSFGAQEKADELLRSMSRDKQLYYFEKILPYDELVLNKLKIDRCVERWCGIEFNANIKVLKTSNPLITSLIVATDSKDFQAIKNIATKLTSKLYN